MKIAKVVAHRLANIPVQTPPFRKLPNKASAVLVEITTDDGHVGWARTGSNHPLIADFINKALAPELVGAGIFELNKTKNHLALAMGLGSGKSGFSSIYRGVWSAIDIAVWDIKGKVFGQPVHRLLGGARDKIHVYITFGVPYREEPAYSIEELVDEAKHHVANGNTALKTIVGQKVRGQQVEPDPKDDYRRLAAVREAIGPDVRLAVDGAYGMSLHETVLSCKAIEQVGIDFVEEPLYENDPELLVQLRQKTTIPIACAETARVSARDLLTGRAIDVLQPNVCNDGGYSAGIELAGMAKAFNTRIGHGNGSGPYNIALHAGVENGTEVEYHQHRWFDFNAIFEHVPQPENGYVTASLEPGTGLTPKEGLIKEYGVRD